MAAGYVTNYGNVENDGLSWATPKRSIQSARDVGLNPIYIKGQFTEVVNSNGTSVICIGYSWLDGANMLTSTNNLFGIIKLKNYIDFNVGYHIRDSIINNISRKLSNLLPNDTEIDTSLIYNVINVIFSLVAIKNNNTFFNISAFEISSNILRLDNNLFSTGNIFSSINYWCKGLNNLPFRYSLFHNCTFKLTGGGLGTDETVYTAPIGANDDEKLQNIRQRMATVYGGMSSQYLYGCKYQTDGDLFIDPEKENFYLVPGCLASRMSYDAGFIGKYPEGSLADFSADFTSCTNMDASGNIIDQTVDAYAETNIIDLGKLRHINSLEALGERAARNGNQVNVDADLSLAVYPGTNLINGKIYIVRTEAISLTVSGKTRDVGETFIAKTADGLAFESQTGYVQEVYLDKPRSIEIKASKIDPTLATAAWVKMDLYTEPRVNYDANGIISHGNLDAGYNVATSERMFIRYWKVRATIKAKNLPA